MGSFMKSNLFLHTILALLADKSSGDGIRGLAIGPIPTPEPTVSPTTIFICSICGDGGTISDEEAIVEVPGLGNSTCLELLAAANAGLIDDFTCFLAQILVEDECGCEDDLTDNPTVKTTSEPTALPPPVTSPVSTPAPSPTNTVEETLEPTDSVTPDPTPEPTPTGTSSPFSPTDGPTEASVTDSPAVPPTPQEDPTPPPDELLPFEVSVVVSIVFDGFAPEIGWSIQDANETVIVDVPIGSYIPLTPSTEETVALMGGQEYVFTIIDLFGDGISNPEDGTFSVTQENTTLVSGGGDFGFSNSTSFITLLY
jgi:hypothetical protein